MVRFLPVTLQKDEEILAVVRRSVLTIFLKILFTFAWFVAPFLFFFPLLRLGGVGLVMLLFLLLGAVLYGWHLWHTFTNTLLILTDRRVIDVDQGSWRTQHVADIPLAEVKTVVTERAGWIAALFDIGLLRIETGEGASFDLEWTGVRHPKRVADLLREMQSLRG